MSKCVRSLKTGKYLALVWCVAMLTKLVLCCWHLVNWYFTTVCFSFSDYTETLRSCNFAKGHITLCLCCMSTTFCRCDLVLSFLSKAATLSILVDRQQRAEKSLLDVVGRGGRKHLICRTSTSLLGRLEAMDWPRCLDYSNGGFGPLLSLSADQK